VVFTKDEDDPVTPIKPYPAHLDYLQNLVEVVHTLPRNLPLFGVKSRQVRATLTLSLYADHECLFLPARRWLLSKSTEDEAIEILADKVRFPHTLLPAWVQRDLQISRKPERRVDYLKTGSKFLAVQQNFYLRKGVGGTSSGVIVDEAPLQDEFEEIIARVLPQTAKFIAIGTPQVGMPGAEAFLDYIEMDVA
jgi:hypothetical protein